jgi:hypothetical protein
MTPRDRRIEDLRIGIIAAQERLNSRDVWELSIQAKEALIKSVSDDVKKLRQEQSRLIKERETDRTSGAEVDESPAPAPPRDAILEEMNAQFRRT